MTIIEGFVALGVMAFFGWMIFSGASKKNPQLLGNIKEWFKDKPKAKLKNPLDKMEQVYDERRSIM